MDMQGSKSARGFRLTCHKLGTGQIYKTTVFRYQTLGSIDWWSLREGISVREAQNCPGGFLCGGNFQTTGTQRRNQSEDCIPLRWVGRYQEAKTRRLRWLKFVRQSTEQKATKKKSFRNLHGEVGGSTESFPEYQPAHRELHKTRQKLLLREERRPGNCKLNDS